MKVFADNKINVTEKLKFILGRVENIVGKGENADYQHFLFFPQCFQKASFSRLLKVRIVWERVKRVERFFRKAENTGGQYFCLFFLQCFLFLKVVKRQISLEQVSNSMSFSTFMFYVFFLQIVDEHFSHCMAKLHNDR